MIESSSATRSTGILKGSHLGDAAIVELKGVSKSFPGPPPVAALRPTSLVVSRGEFVTITGASGSGKSTLLHVMGLLQRPSEGRYLLDGEDITTWSDREMTQRRSRSIGLVFQAFHFVPHLTVAENVALPLTYQGDDQRERLRRARAQLEMVALSHRQDAFPSTLSGGELQRMAVARATVTRPALLLCDEPTGNLDSANSTRVMSLITDVLTGDSAVVLVTHDQSLREHAARVVRVVDGRVDEGPR